MTLGPAPRPCTSCPYRQDVPSGVWEASEYDKLRAYDHETWAQPTKVFLCHQNDRGAEQSRVCSGWAGCHDTDHLLALRLAQVPPEVAQQVIDYQSPVPLFASGSEAADHGQREIDDPSEEAVEVAKNVARRRKLA